MVADWHALMSEYEDPKELRENIHEMVRDFIAVGLDPEKSVIFIQSHVPEHLELAMVFGDITPLAWLERCPTYKEQLREIKGRELATFGFLGYPVLQAADIAIYKADAVPVGVDQLPHLELTREIVRRFNALYKKNLFPEPEPILTKTSKLLGIDNRKMSKSYGNYIAISDPPNTIAKKVYKMVTDPKRIHVTDKGHPNVCTVHSYFAAFAESKVIEEVRVGCEKGIIGCTECKKRLAKILTEYLEPISMRRKAVSDSMVEQILARGARKARDVASETVLEVKQLINLTV